MKTEGDGTIEIILTKKIGPEGPIAGWSEQFLFSAWPHPLYIGSVPQA